MGSGTPPAQRAATEFFPCLDGRAGILIKCTDDVGAKFTLTHRFWTNVKVHCCPEACAGLLWAPESFVTTGACAQARQRRPPPVRETFRSQSPSSSHRGPLAPGLNAASRLQSRQRPHIWMGIRS